MLHAGHQERYLCPLQYIYHSPSPQSSPSKHFSEQVAQLRQRDRASSINDFRWGVNLRLNYSLKGYFSYQCDMTQFTLTHHMVNKPFLLLGLAAEYRSRRWIRGWRRWTLRPTIRCLWHRRTISWQRLRRSAVDFFSKKTKKSLFDPPFLDLEVTYALHP